MGARLPQPQVGDDDALRRLAEVVRRAREAAPSLPVPPPGAPLPPTPWVDAADCDEEGADGDRE